MQNQVNQIAQERDYWERAWIQANNAGVYYKSSYLYWKATCHQRDRRIGQLLREKFALQLLNRQSQQRLQNYKTDEAITTHLLNLIRNRYKKWKRKCRTRENDLLLGDLQLDILYGEDNTNQQLILNLN